MASSSEEAVDWETVYGLTKGPKGQFCRLTMAGGGAHWWNYLIRKQGDEIALFIENQEFPQGRKVSGTLEFNEVGDGGDQFTCGSVRQVPGDTNNLSQLFE